MLQPLISFLSDPSSVAFLPFLGITLVNLTGFVWGVGADETGVNIESFRCRVAPENKTFALDKVGQKRGFAVQPMELTVTIEGEVTGSTGIMAAVGGAATTIANSTAYFGAPTTGKYLDSAEVSSGREGFQRVTAEFSANAGIP